MEDHIRAALDDVSDMEVRGMAAAMRDLGTDKDVFSDGSEGEPSTETTADVESLQQELSERMNAETRKPGRGGQ